MPSPFTRGRKKFAVSFFMLLANKDHDHNILCITLSLWWSYTPKGPLFVPYTWIVIFVRQSIQLHFWMWSYVQISIRYNQTSINDHLHESTTATSLATANFLADSPCIDSCLNPPQRTKTTTFFCPQGGCCEEVQPYKPFCYIRKNWNAERMSKWDDKNAINLEVQCSSCTTLSICARFP